MAARPQMQNFVSGYGAAVNALLDARLKLKEFRERDAATGIVDGLTPEDFSGANSHLDKAAILAAFGTMDQLEQVLTDFSATPPAPTQALAALHRFRT